MLTRVYRSYVMGFIRHLGVSVVRPLDTTMIRPVALQGQNEILEGQRVVGLTQAWHPCAKGRGSIASIGCVATKRLHQGDLMAVLPLNGAL